MTLQELTQQIERLSAWSHGEKIKLFAWYLHTQRGQEHFSGADIGQCYDSLHLERPSDIGSYITQLENQKPKRVLRDSKGLYLAKHVRDELSAKYGQRAITVQVTKLLRELPEKIPDLSERTFLDEALVCYHHGAFRAAIVMSWNLAYHHLCDYVIRRHLTAFNARWPVCLPGHHKKATLTTITQIDVFQRNSKSLR